MHTIMHQYINRHTGKVVNERLFGDRLVNFLYSEVRESAPKVFRTLTSAWGSSLLGYLNFDSVLGTRLKAPKDIMAKWGVDPAECLDPVERLDTPEKVFTRKIKYWDTRPMPSDPSTVVSPADSRVLVGSFRDTSLVFIKNKFFDFSEMLGEHKPDWLNIFNYGDFAIFRLTPEKYHYNHTPVAGRVVDAYDLDGEYHSCNPAAVVSLVTPYSKNRRVVTVIDTDVPGGTQVGLVAMVEVVALMVGDIEQCYSSDGYNYPVPVRPGLFVERGQPKSLFKPGSSTVVLLFQESRMMFDRDILDNQMAIGVQSRFSKGFGKPLVETEVAVRSSIGAALGRLRMGHA
jgi:phosphatidylserine decarboxylase